MQIDGEIQIKDGSIPTTKLELPNDETKFLNGVGEFAEPPSGALPSGNSGNTLYNNGTDWTATNSINITRDESGETVIMQAYYTSGEGGLT